MPGSRTSPANRQLPSILAGAVEPLQRLADQPAPLRCPELCAHRRRAVGRFLREVAEAERPNAGDDEAVGGVALVLTDVPAVGCGADQHRPRNRRRFAQRPLEPSHGGRASSDPHRAVVVQAPFAKRPEAGEPALRSGERVRIVPGERRRLDRDALPVRAEFIRDDLRQPGPDALPGLGLRHGNRDPAVATDLQIRSEPLLAGPQRQV